MKIDANTILISIILSSFLVVFVGLSYLIYNSEKTIPEPEEVIVVAKKIDASVTKAIMDVIKEECFGANVLSIEFMGEESFSLICKIDRKASRRKKK